MTELEHQIFDTVWFWNDTGLHQGCIVKKKKFLSWWMYQVRYENVTVSLPWKHYLTEAEALRHPRKGHPTRAKGQDLDDSI